MLPTDECDGGCTASSIKRKLQNVQPVSLATIISTLPFFTTFLIVALVVLKRLFPLLSGGATALPGSEDENGGYHFSNVSMRSSPRMASNFKPASASSRSTRRLNTLLARPSALVFSTTIGLAAVLAELILCEISNLLNPAARALALNITITTLLVLLIIITPLFEIHSVIYGMGLRFTGTERSRFRFAWLLGLFAFVGWIAAFWWVGHGLPGTHFRGSSGKKSRTSLNEACLERIGVIGIFLMALLSGFAAVSSPWQSFFSKTRPVTESDIARKQSGLEATEDMLKAKRNKLRVLDRKMLEAPQEGFMTRVMGSIRGNADIAERKSLHMEIAGLETMRSSLSSSLAVFQRRHRNQQRASTPRGRLILLVSYVFSLYCLYRIFATSLTTFRRWLSPSTFTFSNTDPINNILAIIAKHWDPSLDRVAWSRQIAFLLSGVILLASFSTVLQTFHFFSRFTPALIHLVQANLALLVSQICATYVISSALLLRSSLPREVGSVISEALGAPLELSFVDRWFEGWFLFASGLTVLGIFLARKIGGVGSGDWDEDFDDGDVELGKRS